MIETLHLVVCDGCGAMGPPARTRALAFAVVRSAGWRWSPMYGTHSCTGCPPGPPQVIVGAADEIEQMSEE